LAAVTEKLAVDPALFVRSLGPEVMTAWPPFAAKMAAQRKAADK
jgi:hypothetical protein